MAEQQNSATASNDTKSIIDVDSASDTEAANLIKGVLAFMENEKNIKNVTEENTEDKGISWKSVALKTTAIGAAIGAGAFGHKMFSGSSKNDAKDIAEGVRALMTLFK